MSCLGYELLYKRQSKRFGDITSHTKIFDIPTKMGLGGGGGALAPLKLTFFYMLSETGNKVCHSEVIILSM